MKEFDSVRGTFASVVILDLLENSHRNKLKDEVEDALIGKSNPAKIEYHRINSFAKLKDMLETVALSADKPIIHFDGHGNKDGIGICDSGELVPWRDVHDLLRPINVRLGGNLLVLMGTCHGALVQTTCDILKPAPLLGFVGATHEIYESDLIEFYRDFYASIDNIGYVDELMEQCRHKDQFFMLTSRDYFKLGAQALLDIPTDQYARELEEKMKARAVQIGLANDKLLEIISEHSTFEYRKDTIREAAKGYFMVGRYPDNWKRFEVERLLESL